MTQVDNSMGSLKDAALNALKESRASTARRKKVSDQQARMKAREEGDYIRGRLARIHPDAARADVVVREYHEHDGYFGYAVLDEVAFWFNDAGLMVASPVCASCGRILNPTGKPADRLADIGDVYEDVEVAVSYERLCSACQAHTTKGLRLTGAAPGGAS